MVQDYHKYTYTHTHASYTVCYSSKDKPSKFSVLSILEFFLLLYIERERKYRNTINKKLRTRVHNRDSE